MNTFLLPPNSPSLWAFILLLFIILQAFLLGVYVSTKKEGANAQKKTQRISFGVIGWCLFFSLFSASGLLEKHPVPLLLVFLLLNVAGAVIFSFSKTGSALAKFLPLWALVGFQFFRVPLELILHHWASLSIIPETMTWTGQNFDIFSGLVALVAAPLTLRFKSAAWIANIVGFGLLLNVFRVAVMSSPLPFAWPVTKNLQPPLQLAFHFPYLLILPICVTGALTGHLILTRALLRADRQ